MIVSTVCRSGPAHRQHDHDTSRHTRDTITPAPTIRAHFRNVNFKALTPWKLICSMREFPG